MRLLLLFMCFMFSGIYCLAQDSRLLVINPTKDNEEDLTRNVFKYKDFLKGIAIYKDQATAEAPMNYNRYFGQIDFITAKGDTMALAHPENFEKIAIGEDTFFYFEKGFIEQITHYAGVNLGRKQQIRFIGREKKGPYGSYSPLTAVSSLDSYSTDDAHMSRIVLDENTVFKLGSVFYLTDRFHNFFPADKKTFTTFFRVRKNS